LKRPADDSRLRTALDEARTAADVARALVALALVVPIVLAGTFVAAYVPARRA